MFLWLFKWITPYMQEWDILLRMKSTKKNRHVVWWWRQQRLSHLPPHYCTCVVYVCKNSFSIRALIYFYTFSNVFQHWTNQRFAIDSIQYCNMKSKCYKFNIVCVWRTNKEAGSNWDLMEGNLPHPVNHKIICWCFGMKLSIILNKTPLIPQLCSVNWLRFGVSLHFRASTAFIVCHQYQCMARKFNPIWINIVCLNNG